MSRWWEDVRAGVRSLARVPGFTATAIVTLALGIGANATLFSLADALYARLLAVPDAARLVHVFQTRTGGSHTHEGDRFFPLSLADYFDYRQGSRSFDALAAHYDGSPMHVVVGGEPLALNGSVVTVSYFSVLRIAPALGRFFAPSEDVVRDRDAVAVIGYRLWQRQFGGSREAIGTSIQINGRDFTVVGVAPPGFEGAFNAGNASQIWIPSAMFRNGYRYCSDAYARDCRIVAMLGRLKAGVSIERAQAELDVIARQIRAANPGINEGLGAVVLPARGAHPERQTAHRSVLGPLIGGVGLLLLIACANVAGLLLARGVARRKEIAVRLALGASRGRLVRQLVVESGLLAAAGGALGLVAAFWSKELAGSFYTADYAGRPLHLEIALGGWTLAATALLSVLTTVLCGVAPALQSTRADVITAVRLDGHASRRVRSITRDGLVVAQIALSIVLLLGSALVVRSMWHVNRGPGVDTDQIVILRLRPSLVGYDSERARTFQREVVRRLALLPGVNAASPSENFPWLGFGGTVSVGMEHRPDTRARASHVGDGYFRVMGQQLLAGRTFDSSDRPGSMPVVVIDDLLASRFGGPTRVLGRPLTVDGRPHQVVGVVRAAQYHTSGQPPDPYVFRNYWQQSGRGFSADSRTHVRVTGDASSMMPRIRREIAAIDPAVPISEDYPVRDRLRFHFQPVRLVMTMLTGFGGVALALSVVGLYGVVKFVATMRTREIAIRLAVGATRRDIRTLVIGHGARLATLGAAAGIASAWGTSRLLASVLYGVGHHDTSTFIVVPALLMGVALLACWIPARRATAIDPASLLRQE